MRKTSASFSTKPLFLEVDFFKSTVVDCEKAVNAKIVDGRLVAESSFELKEKAAACLCCSDFDLTFCDDGVWAVCGDVRRKVGDVVASDPTMLFVQQLKVAVFSCERGTYLCDGESCQKITDLCFQKLIFAYERLFGVKDNVLHFTARDDFFVWRTVQLSNVVSVCFAQDLFAVGNDIVKICFSDKETNVKIQPVLRNVGVVCPRSVDVFGKIVFFVTENALKRYYGNTCETVTDKFTFENAVGAVSQGKYYVTAVDSCGKKCVLCIDCETGKLQSVFSLPASSVVGGIIPYFVTEEGVYAFGEGFSDLFWQSKTVDFGTMGRKYLRKLCVDTESPLDVHVVADNFCKIYHFDGSKHAQIVNIGGSFNKLFIKLFGFGQCKVSKLRVECQSYESGVIAC